MEAGVSHINRELTDIIIQPIVTLPKYGHGEYTSSAHNGYPAIYIDSCVGEKNGRALSKSNDLARTPNYLTLFYKRQRRQPSLLSRFVMVSAKTFTAYLCVHQLANYSSAKLFFFSLDFCVNTTHIFLDWFSQPKRWGKPPEKNRARKVPREILSFWQTER